MKPVIAYMCHTQSSAFEFLELIKSNGGKVKKYVGECRVLSDYEFTDDEVTKDAMRHVYKTEEPEEIEIRLFEEK